MVILVDMDNVIADFDKGVLEGYRRQNPNKLFIPLTQRKTFYIKEQYPRELQPLVKKVYTAKGFYLSLEPIEGAITALNKMSKEHDVFICTSILLENPFCVQEKQKWIKKYLGSSWLKRTIMSKEKTLIYGDILIDDKPTIKGIKKPAWEHFLYSQPYNSDIKTKYRINWKNWESVIASFIPKRKSINFF